MGFPSSEKSPGGDNNSWMIAGVPLRAPLKHISTTTTSAAVSSAATGGEKTECSRKKVDNRHGEVCSGSSSSGGGGGGEYEPTTPTSEGSRIPAIMTCPPAPRKRKTAPARCNNGNSSKREFFVVPPDLEAVFMRRRHVGC